MKTQVSLAIVTERETQAFQRISSVPHHRAAVMQRNRPDARRQAWNRIYRRIGSLRAIASSLPHPFKAHVGTVIEDIAVIARLNRSQEW